MLCFSMPVLTLSCWAENSAVHLSDGSIWASCQLVVWFMMVSPCR